MLPDTNTFENTSNNTTNASGDSLSYGNYGDRNLTFSRLNDWGRLGNQLFELAALFGLAHKYHYNPCVPPDWKYRPYFRIPDEFYKKVDAIADVSYGKYEYDPEFLSGINASSVDITGGFQSEKWFLPIRDFISSMLRPAYAFTPENAVGIHVRRGDYVGNPNYVQYDEFYYYDVIRTYFPNDKDFVVVSDDLAYIQDKFGPDAEAALGVRFHISHQSDILDLFTLASCRRHILSNSSFSWWGAYLGRSEYAVHPPRTHTGGLAHLDEKDLWPVHWKEYTPRVPSAYFLTYATPEKEQARSKLSGYAMNSGQFLFVINSTPADLNDEFKARNARILSESKGAGFWLWKPQIILQALMNMNEGDLLLYMDADDWFFGNVVEFMRKSLTDDIALVDSANRQIEYCSRECYTAMQRDLFHESETQVEAGIIMVRNSPKSRRVIKQWLEVCEKPEALLDPSGNQLPWFKEHRHDQAILTNLRYQLGLKTVPIHSHFICNRKDFVGRMDDVTFVIPTKYDHPDRIRNLKAVLRWTRQFTGAKVIVGECDTTEMGSAVTIETYAHFGYEMFHRTRMINEMTYIATTPIVVNLDADVVVPPDQMRLAVQMLREGSEFVYPYNGDFLRVPAGDIGRFDAQCSTFNLLSGRYRGHGDNSVGGIVAYRKDAFFRVGGENENYISWGSEDISRSMRFATFGKCVRTPGPLFHLDHFRGCDSRLGEFSVITRSEIRREKQLLSNKDAYWRYITGWPWLAKYQAAL